jgi:YVTN family beta-propeller protein
MTLEANGVTTHGTFQFSDDGRFALFQPSQTLPFSASCKILVAAGALDLDGQAAPADSCVFTTQAQPALALASLSPRAVPVGGPVVLSGSGFSTIASQNLVLFNGAIANVSSATTDELRVNVPNGATTGSVTVHVGIAVSNALAYTLAEPLATVVAEGAIPLRPGIRHIAITPDGLRAYVTNPLLNTVSLLGFVPPQRLATITAGYRPQGLAIVPDGSRAYVANTGSNDVSVIDVKPTSPDYNKVIDVIPVAQFPVEVGISPIGPRVIVASADSAGTVSILDGDPGNGTYDQVVAKITVGSAGVNVAISADGGRAFILTEGGELVVVDLAPGSPTENQVVAKTTLGSSGVSVAIAADGTILLVLLANGDLLVVDVTPGSPTENQVIAKTVVGSGGQSVAISADGGTAFVSNGIDILRFAIQGSSGGAGSTIAPGAVVTLTPQGSMTAGNAPAQVVFDPIAGTVVVVNEGSGTVTVMSEPPVTGVEPPVTPSLAPGLELLGRMPATGEAQFRFSLPAAADVRLEIVDVLGRRVSTLASGRREAGVHLVWWRGETAGGGRAP